MLISFSVENFRSISAREELTFVASRHQSDLLPVLSSKNSMHGILPVIAMFGSNGAGKTNMISALRYMQKAVIYSQTVWPPLRTLDVEPHFFTPDEDSKFESHFEIGGEVYRFGFSCNRNGFSGEWLFSGRKSMYRRVGNHYRFGESFRGSKTIKEFVRGNSLFLSAAAQNNHPLLSRIYKWFKSWDDIDHTRDSERAFTIHLLRDTKYKDFLRRSLSVLNPDIVSIEVEDKGVKVYRPDAETYARDLRAWKDVQVVHKSPKTGKLASLSLSEESRGTQDYFALVGSIALVLEQGGVLILDEAGASLHPTLLKAIIALFQSKITNPHGSQIVVSTHETTILTPESLRPDEVWFAEKRDESSHYYSLADFEGIRSDTKSQKLYLEGRFGAIPFLENHLSMFKDWVNPESVA